MKYNYLWTSNYKENEPNNGYLEEVKETENFGAGYTFSDWLRDSDVNYDLINSTDTEFIVVDDEGEPTGERYLIIKRIPSDIEKFLYGEDETSEKEALLQKELLASEEKNIKALSMIRDVIAHEQYERMTKEEIVDVFMQTAKILYGSEFLPQTWFEDH